MTKLLARRTAPSLRKNNKGFSLIELIIVITIMAILTALIAPQLLRYVEQSRVAKDANTLDEAHRAFQLALIADGVTGNGRLWYTSDGRIANVNHNLANEIGQILGYPIRRTSGTLSEVYGLPPLSSKLYSTNPSSDSRSPTGAQVFLYTQIKNAAGIVVDCSVKYENNPRK